MSDRQRIADAVFLESPGVYVVFEDEVADTPLYVGVAARQTLAKRWQANHLGGRAGSSSLRRTLGKELGLVDKKLSRPDRYYPSEVEEQITAHLRRLWIELHPTEDGASAEALEARLIRDLCPTLNVARPRVDDGAAPSLEDQNGS